ncbi:Transport-related membrane protein [Cupriavidus sp. U2]|uniref:FUSC family protein n=1 Tax=Cupriavidus sp. U2 TaxID=2920269 RepID=UPI001892C963|nr:FUSC family protein [Cupriavidus sp. U2]KAI3590261.1 Transport-related membrane protein [Cupriavidus sp. U2]
MNVPRLKSLDLKALARLPSDPAWSGWIFAIRTTAASLIALYIAFLMNLDDPKWAAMTVWIVAQPHRGMTLSKSQYRIVGTVIGAVVAVALTALFAQTPELFLLTLAARIGICTAVATSLRNFRSYAGVLAGYTAAIVGMGAGTAPLHAFDIAVARCLYIILGIVVEAALTSCFAIGEPDRDLRNRFDRYVAQASGMCARLLRRDQDGEAMHRLFAGAMVLDNAAEFSAAASSTARRKLGHFRELAVSVLAQLAAAQTLGEQLARFPEIDNGLVEDTACLLDRVTKAPDGLRTDIAAMQWRVDQALQREGARTDGDATPQLMVLNRIRLLLAALQDVTTRAAQVDQPEVGASRQRLTYHIDAVLAWRNGLRAFAAVLAASAFWIFSAWPAGAGFVTISGVVSALFATRPNAVGVSLAFLKGAVCAALVAALCNFALLPAISGVVPFACVVGCCMVAAGVAMCNPRIAAIGNGAAVFFWNFISPLNGARIADAAFLNGAVATLIGIAFGAAAFSILLPADPDAVRRRLRRAAYQDLIQIADRRRGWHAKAWLGRTADRLNRLTAVGSTNGAIGEADVRGHIAAWAIGYSLLTMQELANTSGTARRLLAVVQRRLQRGDLDRVVRVCRSAASRLQGKGGGLSDDRRERLATAILLHSIADRASTHGAFLQGQAPAH